MAINFDEQRKYDMLLYQNGQILTVSPLVLLYYANTLLQHCCGYCSTFDCFHYYLMLHVLDIMTYVLSLDWQLL